MQNWVDANRRTVLTFFPSKSNRRKLNLNLNLTISERSYSIFHLHFWGFVAVVFHLPSTTDPIFCDKVPGHYRPHHNSEIRAKKLPARTCHLCNRNPHTAPNLKRFQTCGNWMILRLRSIARACMALSKDRCLLVKNKNKRLVNIRNAILLQRSEATFMMEVK